MNNAVGAVVNDGISVRRAAVEYSVPRSTLGDRISGRVMPGAVSGRSRYLSPEEEEELVSFFVKMWLSTVKDGSNCISAECVHKTRAECRGNPWLVGSLLPSLSNCYLANTCPFVTCESQSVRLRGPVTIFRYAGRHPV